MPDRAKLSLVGGGSIGEILALESMRRGLADITTIDIPDKESLVQGKMLDIYEATPITGKDVKVQGTADFSGLKDSDVVVVTGGIPRRPGMTRDDLVATNVKIISDIASNVKKYCPKAFCIIITNPLDAMVYAFQKVSGLPHNMVCGMAGVLDTSRFKSFVALELGVSVQDVSAIVMGGHGPTMVPLPRLCTVGGVPLTALMNKDAIDKIITRTQEAGTEIVQLMKTGSAFVSPALSAIEMAESFIKDRKRVLPCAAYLNGEYDISGYYMGVPAVIGKNGIEKVLQIPLESDEKGMLAKTLEAVKKSVASTGL